MTWPFYISRIVRKRVQKGMEPMTAILYRKLPADIRHIKKIIEEYKNDNGF